MRIKIMLPTSAQLVNSKGLGQGGQVQRFHTMNVNRRIGKYMPHLSGTLETKLKRVCSDTEIEILGPYAKYQYYGKVMEGQPPKALTDRPLNYTKDFNPLAGPFWDKALVAAEGDTMQQELQDFVNKGG